MAKLRDGPGKVRAPTAFADTTGRPWRVQAKTSANGQNAIQQRALRTLKQKRMYENQLMQLQQQTWNMEQAAMTTENLKNTVSDLIWMLSGCQQSGYHMGYG